MSQSDIEVILYRLSDLDKKMVEMKHNLDATLGELKVSGLAKEERIRKLESIVDQMKGAGMAGKAIWAFLGAGGLSIAIGLFNMITKKS